MGRESTMTTHITLYGIAHCDTVRKSCQWFASQGVAVTFHDFKKQGVPPEALAQWTQALGWQTLLNRRGTTWRQLPAEQQDQAQDDASARALMQAHPGLIKRPVAVCQQDDAPPRLTVGFAPQDWARWPGAQAAA